MYISGIYTSIIWIMISTISWIVWNYTIVDTVLFWFIILGAIISLIGTYIQYQESQPIKISVLLKQTQGWWYECNIPYKLHNKRHPSVTIFRISDNALCQAWVNIDLSNNVIITTAWLVDLYCIIK